MDACLMVGGQEDVTWEDWLALAAACEEHGRGKGLGLEGVALLGREIAPVVRV